MSKGRIETNLENNIEEVEGTTEDLKEYMQANEEDFIAGLIDSIDYADDEIKEIEIARNGKVLYKFKVRPLSEEEFDKCRKRCTKYVRNKQLGMKMPEETNTVKFKSMVIYEATIEEDKERYWNNKKVWEAYGKKGYQIVTGTDVIEASLRAGEKERVYEVINEASGFDGSMIEVAKN